MRYLVQCGGESRVCADQREALEWKYLFEQSPTACNATMREIGPDGYPIDPTREEIEALMARDDLFDPFDD